MKFTVDIEMGNDAMLTKGDFVDLVEQIDLSYVNVGDKKNLKDDNGNTVGYYSLEK